MTPCELTAAVTALANAIACRVTDNNALNLLSLVLTQLGDTLATIAAQRQCLCAQSTSPSPPKNGGQKENAAARQDLPNP